MLTIPGVKFIDPATEQGSKMSMVIYGHHGSGKSDLLADALKYYQEQGKNVVYVVIQEDPYMTIRHYDLGACVVQIDNYLQYEQLMTKLGPDKAHVVVVDSLTGLQRITFDKVIGRNKYPEVQMSGPDKKNEWAPCHEAFIGALELWKNSAVVSLAACPADRSSDAFLTPDAKKANLITCDLAGKAATGIRGKVQFMGYLLCEFNDKDKSITRTLDFTPSNHILTRTNGLARQILEPIGIDSHGGSWAKVLDVFEQHRVAV